MNSESNAGINYYFFVTGAMDYGYYSNLIVNGVEQSQYLTSYSDPSPCIDLSPPSDPTVRITGVSDPRGGGGE